MEDDVQAQRTASPKRGYSIEEFGTVYGICRSLIYIEIRDGRLKARKIGRRTIIATEDGEEWFSKLDTSIYWPLGGAAGTGQGDG
jgi:hypothetical protein